MPNRSDSLPFLTRRQFSFFVAASAMGLLGRSSGFAVAAAGSKPAAGLAPLFPLASHTADSFAALMEYVPQVDPDAGFFQSRVPRAVRIPAFAPAQAHPRLSPEPQVATLTGCYRTLGEQADERYKRQRYGTPPPDGVYVTRFIGYHDVVVNWSGPGVIPNPAMTDAAHRNGALCLGTIFQPDKRIFDSSMVPARQVAAKFVELAIFFGFDGYFMNFEMGTPEGHNQVLDLLGMMHQEAHRLGKMDFYIQFYDGSASMSRLMPVADGAPAVSFADSTMLDQGWSGYSMTHGCCSGQPTDAESVYAYCIKKGLDPYKSAFFGYQLYPGPGYLCLSAPSVIHPNDSATAYGSLQLYSFDDGLHTMQAAKDQRDGKPATGALSQEEYYTLERCFFSGQSQNPALNNTPNPEQARIYADVAGGARRYTDYEPGQDHPTDQVKFPITYGVANFTVEHSVIGAFPFVSHFNLGAGEGFFLQGRKVSNRPWFNMGIQDLLPTWQWWQEPMHGGLHREAAKYAPLNVRYDQSVAFDGGASLHISGRLQAKQSVALRLYKTQLRVENADDLRLHLVWQGAAEMKQALSVGLIFQDAPERTQWVAFSQASRVSHQALSNGWVRSELPLADYLGRTIAALLLGFETAGAKRGTAQVDVHLGEIFAGSGSGQKSAAAPQGFAIEAYAAASETGALNLRLCWKREANVASYDLFCVSGNAAKRSWLGRVYAGCYYAENVPREPGSAVRFELTSTSLSNPLQRSLPAEVELKAD